MKAFIKISALVAGITLTAVMQSLGQTNLPSACTGSVEKYWVKGLNGHSDFTWQITDPDGNIVPPSNYTLVGRGDTVQINWGSSLKGGIYTFSVTEHSDNGCTGEPYTQDIVLNSPTINIPFTGVPTSVAVCFGDTAKLDPGSFLNYLWQDGTTKRIYATTQSGTYQVRLIQESDQSCSYNEIEAKINPLPFVWLGNDTVLFGNQSMTLDAFGSGIDFYEWSTGAIASSITVDGQSGNQQVWVKVTDQNGCKNSDTLKISAADYDKLRIPAAFTPNGDGINDKWYFPGPDKQNGQDLFPYFEDVTVRIFNRWGKLVWESTKEFKAWDGKDLNGKDLPMDSYHYIIRFKVGDKTHLYKGTITIVR